MITRAREAGVEKIFIPAIDLPSVDTVLAVCRRFPDTCYPMIGLQPEEVRADWQEVLAKMHRRLMESIARKREGRTQPGETSLLLARWGLDFLLVT